MFCVVKPNMGVIAVFMVLRKREEVRGGLPWDRRTLIRLFATLFEQ